MSDQTVYSFVQDMGGGNITQVAGVTTLGVLAFRLSYLDQAATFSALFDQFRICQIQVTFRPLITQAPPMVTTVTMPTFVTVVDIDDATAPGSIASMREYNNALPSIYETTQRTFVPGTLIGAQVQTRTWIDMASYNTQDFFSVKYGLEAGQGGQTLLQVISYTVRMHFECRRVR